MINYTLHKLPEGFIVTSDKLLKDGTLFYNPPTNYFGKTIRKEGNFWVCENMEGFHLLSQALKVIAQQEQIDFSGLSEDEQKKIGWFDVEKLAKERFCYKSFNPPYSTITPAQRIKGFEVGFQKAQELLSERRFTLEEVLKIADKYHNTMCLYGNVKGKEYLQSLSQPESRKVELEMECAYGDNCPSKGAYLKQHLCKIQPKLTNGKIKITKIL
jgi:hypothetical protein